MNKLYFLSISLLFACSEYNVTESKNAESGVNPVIEVTPAALSFIDAEVGAPEEDLFTISNAGGADLNISNMQLVGSEAFSFTQLGNPILTPGQSSDVYVTYTPSVEGAEDEGSIIITSNDPDNQMIEVPLNGVVAQDLPVLQINPLVMDLGNQGVGSVTTGTFELESVGELPVTLNTFYLTGTQFSILPNESWPITLSPGETTTVDVSFEPDTTGTFSEVFTVDCDEPASDPTATINGSATGSAPVADCYVDPAALEPNTGQEATWYGIDSYDPTGAAITDYDWSLISKPAGSQVSMPSGNSANVGRFSPDLAGDYVGQLIVTNEFGIESAPCQTTLVGVPGQDLWIQMSWTESGDDMDLHMTYNNGNYNSSNDCYFSNCKSLSNPLDWGDTGRHNRQPLVGLG